MKIFIPGQVPAQKNSKHIAHNKRTGRPFIMTDARVKNWQAVAMKYLQDIKPIYGPVEIELSFTHIDKRKRDIDNECSSIMDLLKNNQIIEDDNCFIVKKITLIFAGVDKENCGVNIIINKIS